MEAGVKKTERGIKDSQYSPIKQKFKDKVNILGSHDVVIVIVNYFKSVTLKLNGGHHLIQERCVFVKEVSERCLIRSESGCRRDQIRQIRETILCDKVANELLTEECR